MGLSLSKAPIHLTKPGTFFYILDKKKLPSGNYKLYVEELTHLKAHKFRYWIDYDHDDPAFELYDNSWFDRFLKPTGEADAAYVGRLVQEKPVQLNASQFWKIRSRPHLYKYYPTNDQVPRTNLHKPVKATDFLQCVPSKEPPQHKNGNPCDDRGEAVQLPPFMWVAIEEALTQDPELKVYYDNGIITPPMIAAAAHLETRFSPLVENEAEKRLCEQGQCTPYKWGKAPGQIGDSESVSLWNIHWEPPKDHNMKFVRNFEAITRKVLGSCGLEEGISKKCVKKYRKHMQNCRLYEKLNNSTSHSFCFKPAFKMFAHKMKNAFSAKSIVWEQKYADKKIQLQKRPIYKIIEDVAKGDKNLWFATSARLRAGYINRGAMVNLSLQECINHPNSIQCSYGNLANQVSRRPSSEKRLGTPPKYLGAQILKGEFINRCHVWYFAGLCGPVREDSLLDQYTQIYQKTVGPIPPVSAKAI